MQMTVKEYAKHVDASVRTVRRWVCRGQLAVVRQGGHRAMLVDSDLPRPKKKVTRSTSAARQDVGPVVDVPRPADLPQNPVIERESQLPRREPIEDESETPGPVCDDDGTSRNGGGFVMLALVVAALAGPVITLLRERSKQAKRQLDPHSEDLFRCDRPKVDQPPVVKAFEQTISKVGQELSEILSGIQGKE